ncbi:hypothetical protein AAFG13_38165 [Bradyrhizobium sp. B124]
MDRGNANLVCKYETQGQSFLLLTRALFGDVRLALAVINEAKCPA